MSQNWYNSADTFRTYNFFMSNSETENVWYNNLATV